MGNLGLHLGADAYIEGLENLNDDEMMKLVI
jgi:hypothetical protein